MRPLLVGEDNPHSLDPRRALATRPRGAAGDRLRRILRLGEREYLRRFDRVNLCAARWSLAEARDRARDLRIHSDASGTPLILLGAKVCAAFRVPFAPFKRDGLVLVLPHPSGLCRVWNDPRMAPRARRAVRRLLTSCRRPVV